MTDFIFRSHPLLLPATMLVVLALSFELPYRFGRPLVARDAGNDDAWNIVQGGLLTLMAFVIGLSFAQAAGRFDARRELVVKEANAIGTTWLRADQLPPAQALRFRQILTDYTAARLKAYSTPGARELYLQTIERSNRDQATLWSMVSPELRAHPTNLGLSLLMQTLNDTIDVSAEQLQALSTRVPTAIVVLAIVLLILAVVATGFRYARDGARPAILSGVLVVACVVIITMMIDYDRPQTGFVTVNLNPLTLQLESMQHPQP